MSPRTKEQNLEIREQTRKQILDAAFELFANEGYSKTSIAAVAKSAKVSKGLIYHYFTSKEDILNGIIDNLVELGEEMMGFPDGFTPKDKLRFILEQSFMFIEHQPGLGKLMIGLGMQNNALSTIKPKIDKINKDQLMVFASIMEELGYESPEIAAYQLGATMDGILMARIAMGEDYPLQELKQKLLREYVPD